MTKNDFIQKWLPTASAEETVQIMQDLESVGEVKTIKNIDGWFLIRHATPDIGRVVDVQYLDGTIAHQREINKERLDHFIKKNVNWRPSTVNIQRNKKMHGYI